MKLKHFLFAALAMLTATSAYAEVNVDEAIELDNTIISAYWLDDYGYWESYGTTIWAYEDAIGSIYFESEYDFEVSFDYNVGYDANFIIRVDDEAHTGVTYYDYQRSGSFKKEFTAGMHYITFEFSLPEVYEGTGTSVEITNFKAIADACDHLFPEESTYPATCTEPSKSVCDLCGKTLEDGKSEALGHDWDNNYECKREGCGFVETRYQLLNTDGVNITMEDNEYPWVFYQSGMGLMSSNYEINSSTSKSTITLTSEFNFTLSFDYSVSSEEGWDKLTVVVNSETVANELSGNNSGSYVSEGSAKSYKIVVSYSKDSMYSRDDDRSYITNIKLTTELDKNEDGKIEVGDLMKGLSPESGITQEQKQAIIDFILNRE